LFPRRGSSADAPAANPEAGDPVAVAPPFDVVVVGAGVLGAAVSSRLSATTARVALVEAENDVAEHASKGNAGVAVSYYGPPGTQQASLITASNPGWEQLCARLDVPYRRIGGLMVALSADEAARLEETLEEVRACGVRAELLTAKAVRDTEPYVAQTCVSGLLLPDEGVIDPMRLTVAYARLAARNGVEIRLGERVIAIERHGDLTTVVTDQARLQTRFVVNASGVRAGEVSALAGGQQLVSWPRQGQYVVLDRSFGETLSKIVFSTHTAETKGCNVVPTTHGSVLLGPTARDLEEPEDRATDAETIDGILEQARRLVPATAEAHAIKTFAANRPAGDEPHRLRIDANLSWLLHVTDRSAGVSISPAAADLALALLNEAGLDAADRADAAAGLPAVQRLRTAADPTALTAIDPLYGQVVCACEHVSAAEINRALEGPVPAISVDGVRKRTGAAYGRCQGSLCLAGISFLTAMHTGTGPATVRQTARGTVGS
jgi:glycerol-3-phosphate dehydrogenase